MTRQETLETIGELLPQQPQEKLEALLGWLEQDDDAFEKQLRADVEAGKFDRLIADVIAEDDAGETIDLSIVQRRRSGNCIASFRPIYSIWHASSTAYSDKILSTPLCASNP